MGGGPRALRFWSQGGFHRPMWRRIFSMMSSGRADGGDDLHPLTTDGTYLRIAEPGPVNHPSPAAATLSADWAVVVSFTVGEFRFRGTDFVL